MSEKKIIHNAGMRLRCDACDHVMPMPGAFGPELIGYPCPKCGSDMLTQKDFEAMKTMLGTIDAMNALFGDMGSEEPGDEALMVRVQLHDDAVIIRPGHKP